MTRYFRNLTICLGLALASLGSADDTRPVAFVELQCRKSGGPSASEEAEAVQMVRAKLLNAYVSSLGPERRQALEAKLTTAHYSEAGAYLDNYTVRTRHFDKKRKVLTLSAQATVDVSKINMLIDGPTSGEKNPIVFVFVARRQAEVETRSPKVTTGTQQSESIQKEAASTEGAGFSTATVGSRTSESVATISSVTRTADRIVYVLEDNAKAAIDRTMSKVFIDRGFDSVSAADLVEATEGAFNPDELQKDFETSSQFTLENQRRATRACREAGVPLLAYGTLTIGVQRPDPVNPANVAVNVIVDAQVLDCRRLLTIKVGSVGALQVEGVGSDQTQAELVGLEMAAKKAAQILADQLRNRRIR